MTHDQVNSQSGESTADARPASSDGFFQQQDEQRWEAPRRIGPYRIVRRLGAGGMGIVYLAVRDQDKLTKRVALKVVKHGVDTESVLGRFDFERQILSALNHSGIARLLDAGRTEDGRPYFVMEYVDGQPIDEYCDTHRLTIRQRLELFAQVCEAVHAAHQNLILHRDLKPANVLVTSDGTVKLLDFGIAKLLNPDLSPVDFVTTEFGADRPPMTPEYASPEQVRGDPLSTACDIYSLGVLLYELLTGCRPYRLKTRLRKELERIICYLDPDQPSTALTRITEVAAADDETDIPDPTPATRHTTEEIARDRRVTTEKLSRLLMGDLDNIIMTAMRKTPQDRYASAEQFAEDIGRHLRGEQTIARPLSRREKLFRFIRQHRGPVAAVVAIVAILAVSTTTTTAMWRQSNAAHQRTETVAVAANELIDFLLNDVHNALKDTRDGIRVRSDMVKKANKYLEDVPDIEDVTSVDVRRQLAMVRMRIGQIKYGPGQDLGQVGQALSNYEDAHERLALLHAEYPEDEEVRLWYGWAKRYLAWHHLKQDQIDDAERFFTGAYEIGEELRHHDEHGPLATLLAAFASRGLGDIAKKRASTDTDRADEFRKLAVQWYEAGIDTRRDMLARATDTESKRDAAGALQITLRRTADVYKDLGRTVEARRLLEQSLRLAERQSNDPSFSTQRHIWSSHLQLAALLASSGDPGDMEAAEASYSNALNITLEMHDRDPENQSARMYVPITRSVFGQFLMSCPGQADRGCRQLRLAIEEQRAYCDDHVDDERAHQYLASFEAALERYCDS